MRPSVLLHSLSPVLDAAKAQSVESELIENHREEVTQLKKLVTQKEEDLHKTVQKYEQVLQVARKTTFGFDFREDKSRNKEMYTSHHHLEAISVGSCPLGCGFPFGRLSHELRHLLH